MNHVAIEVGDVEEALAWYGRIFEFGLRGRGRSMAFIDMGDQFIALAAGRTQPPDRHRHIGIVVDDAQRALAAAREAGADVRANDVLDPWGNNLQIVDYREVQFTKAPSVLSGMGVEALDKTPQALEELRRKGLAPGAELQRLSTWLDAYGDAWEREDVEAFVALFAPDARYAWGPFDSPLVGHGEIRARTLAAVSDQREIGFGHEPLAVTPDGRGIARWWVTYRARDGTQVRDEGIFLVTLDEHGRCVDFREWWNEREA
jgi:lactoylglutathione lyase